jgi:hypothetical protein
MNDSMRHQRAENRSLRIGTWNLQRPTPPERRQRQAVELARINADVWILTESHLDSAPYAAYTGCHSAESRTLRTGAVGLDLEPLPCRRNNRDPRRGAYCVCAYRAQCRTTLRGLRNCPALARQHLARARCRERCCVCRGVTSAARGLEGAPRPIPARRVLCRR